MTQSLTHAELDIHLRRVTLKTSTFQERKQALKHFMENFAYTRFASERFPICKLIYNYNVRNDLLRDFLAGISCGMAMIPQAMGYATVLGVPIEYGLYSIVFSSLIYTLFTTSIHASCTISIAGVLFSRDSLEDFDFMILN